ncbi:MAG TPA: ABC transporter permease, partial [Candidatus Binatia bacterium]
MAKDLSMGASSPALPRWLAVSLTFARRRPLGAAGAAVILVMLFAAVFAGFISPYDPLTTDYAAMLQAPSAAHWLGTDSFGRDVLARIIYGSRTALLVGFTASFFGATLGAMLGV